MSSPLPLPWLILLPLLSCAAPLRASPLQEAQAAFAAGDFAKAAPAYQQLIATEGPSASRLYQLGNAYFSLGQFGQAVLAYERAALLQPRASDIQANLQQARQSAAPSAIPDTPSALTSPTRWLSLHEWSWITALGAAGLGFLTLAWGLHGFTTPQWQRAARLGLALSLTGTILGGTALWLRRNEAHWGIVIALNPTLRLSPFAEAASAGPLNSGSRVILGPQVQGWTRLTVPERNVAGWLPHTEVAPLIPRPGQP